MQVRVAAIPAPKRLDQGGYRHVDVEVMGRQALLKGLAGDDWGRKADRQDAGIPYLDPVGCTLILNEIAVLG